MIANSVLQGTHAPKALVKLQVPTRRFNASPDITAQRVHLTQGNSHALQEPTIRIEDRPQTYALLALKAITVQLERTGNSNAQVAISVDQAPEITGCPHAQLAHTEKNKKELTQTIVYHALLECIVKKRALSQFHVPKERIVAQQEQKQQTFLPPPQAVQMCAFRAQVAASVQTLV